MNEPVRPPGAPVAAFTFDDVYARELAYVWRTLGRLGVPASDLDDATHDVFVVVFRRWADFDGARPVRPWLFGIARRVAADLRKRARPAGEEVDVAAPADPRTAADGEHAVLWRALGALDEDRRVVVILHELEGYTAAEIAAVVDVPVATVHSRLRLARADLVAAVRRLQAQTQTRGGR